jgi:hypothetical protein
MAHLYIDDGDAESEDYTNNYVYFNGQDPACVEKMVVLARRLASLSPERKRNLLDKIQMRTAAVHCA